MALWVDKYRPKSLGALEMHPRITDLLKALVSNPQTQASNVSTEHNLRFARLQQMISLTS
jgi:hypothetical protein